MRLSFVKFLRALLRFLKRFKTPSEKFVNSLVLSSVTKFSFYIEQFSVKLSIVFYYQFCRQSLMGFSVQHLKAVSCCVYFVSNIYKPEIAFGISGSSTKTFLSFVSLARSVLTLESSNFFQKM